MTAQSSAALRESMTSTTATTGTVHGLQPCEALLGLLGTDDAFNEDPRLTGTVDHRGGQTGEELPALTGQRPARIEPETREAAGSGRSRNENQHRYGATEVADVLARNAERHSASIAPPCLWQAAEARRRKPSAATCSSTPLACAR